MKLNKKISKILGLSLFASNFTVYPSIATTNMEIPNRYQTLEGEYITIDDSTEGELHEIEIFGNTVQDENNLEDIQSIGDLYVDNKGNPILDSQGREQYKIDIVSTNYCEKVELEKGSLDYLNGNEINANTIRNKGFLDYSKYVNKTIYVETSLPLSSQSYFTLIYYDENKNYVNWTNSWVTINGGGVYNFKIPEMSGDIKYFRFCKYDAYYDGSGEFTNEDVKEKSSSFVIEREIEDYYETFLDIENKTTILLPTQLQKA